MNEPTINAKMGGGAAGNLSACTPRRSNFQTIIGTVIYNFAPPPAARRFPPVP